MKPMCLISNIYLMNEHRHQQHSLFRKQLTKWKRESEISIDFNEDFEIRCDMVPIEINQIFSIYFE